MLGVDAVQWLVQTGNLSDTMGDDLHRLAAAAERIAETMEEANRWKYTIEEIEDEKGLVRYCMACGKQFVADLFVMGEWEANQPSQPGCPRCRGKEASDAEA